MANQASARATLVVDVDDSFAKKKISKFTSDVGKEVVKGKMQYDIEINKNNIGEVKKLQEEMFSKNKAFVMNIDPGSVLKTLQMLHKEGSDTSKKMAEDFSKIFEGLDFSMFGDKRANKGNVFGQLEQTASSIDQIKNKIAELENIKNEKFGDIDLSTFKSKIKEAESQLESLKEQKLNIKMGSSDFKKIDEEISASSSRVLELKKEFKELEDITTNIELNESKLSGLENAKKLLEEILGIMNSTNGFNLFENIIELSSINKDVDSISESLLNLKNTLDSLNGADQKNIFDSLKTAILEYDDITKNIDSIDFKSVEEEDAMYDMLNEKALEIKDLTSKYIAVSDVLVGINKNSISSNISGNIGNFLANVPDDFGKENADKIRGVKDEILKYIEEIGTNVNSSQIPDITSRINNIINESLNVQDISLSQSKISELQNNLMSSIMSGFKIDSSILDNFSQSEISSITQAFHSTNVSEEEVTSVEDILTSRFSDNTNIIQAKINSLEGQLERFNSLKKLYIDNIEDLNSRKIKDQSLVTSDTNEKKEEKTEQSSESKENISGNTGFRINRKQVEAELSKPFEVSVYATKASMGTLRTTIETALNNISIKLDDANIVKSIQSSIGNASFEINPVMKNGAVLEIPNAIINGIKSTSKGTLYGYSDKYYNSSELGYYRNQRDLISKEGFSQENLLKEMQTAAESIMSNINDNNGNYSESKDMMQFIAMLEQYADSLGGKNAKGRSLKAALANLNKFDVKSFTDRYEENSNKLSSSLENERKAIETYKQEQLRKEEEIRAAQKAAEENAKAFVDKANASKVDINKNSLDVYSKFNDSFNNLADGYSKKFNEGEQQQAEVLESVKSSIKLAIGKAGNGKRGEDFYTGLASSIEYFEKMKELSSDGNKNIELNLKDYFNKAGLNVEEELNSIQAIRDVVSNLKSRPTEVSNAIKALEAEAKAQEKAKTSKTSSKTTSKGSTENKAVSQQYLKAIYNEVKGIKTEDVQVGLHLKDGAVESLKTVIETAIQNITAELPSVNIGLNAGQNISSSTQTSATSLQNINGTQDTSSTNVLNGSNTIVNIPDIKNVIPNMEEVLSIYNKLTSTLFGFNMSIRGKNPDNSLFEKAVDYVNELNKITGQEIMMNDGTGKSPYDYFQKSAINNPYNAINYLNKNYGYGMYSGRDKNIPKGLSEIDRIKFITDINTKNYNSAKNNNDYSAFIPYSKEMLKIDATSAQSEGEKGGKIISDSAQSAIESKPINIPVDSTSSKQEVDKMYGIFQEFYDAAQNLLTGVSFKDSWNIGDIVKKSQELSTYSKSTLKNYSDSDKKNIEEHINYLDTLIQKYSDLKSNVTVGDVVKSANAGTLNTLGQTRKSSSSNSNIEGINNLNEIKSKIESGINPINISLSNEIGGLESVKGSIESNLKDIKINVFPNNANVSEFSEEIIKEYNSTAEHLRGSSVGWAKEVLNGRAYDSNNARAISRYMGGMATGLEKSDFSTISSQKNALEFLNTYEKYLTNIEATQKTINKYQPLYNNILGKEPEIRSSLEQFVKYDEYIKEFGTNGANNGNVANVIPKLDESNLGEIKTKIETTISPIHISLDGNNIDGINTIKKSIEDSITSVDISLLESKLNQLHGQASDTTTNYDKVAVAQAAGSEVADIQMIKVAVEDLITSINNKTTAFINERNEVSSIAANEVADINMIKIAIESLIEQINAFTGAFTSANNSNGNIINDLITNLELVKLALDEIKINKNFEIIDNNSLVNLQSLISLLDDLDVSKINTTIADIDTDKLSEFSSTMSNISKGFDYADLIQSIKTINSGLVGITGNARLASEAMQNIGVKTIKDIKSIKQTGSTIENDLGVTTGGGELSPQGIADYTSRIKNSGEFLSNLFSIDKGLLDSNGIKGEIESVEILSKSIKVAENGTAAFDANIKTAGNELVKFNVYISDIVKAFNETSASLEDVKGNLISGKFNEINLNQNYRTNNVGDIVPNVNAWGMSFKSRGVNESSSSKDVGELIKTFNGGIGDQNYKSIINDYAVSRGLEVETSKFDDSTNKITASLRDQSGELHNVTLAMEEYSESINGVSTKLTKLKEVTSSTAVNGKLTDSVKNQFDALEKIDINNIIDSYIGKSKLYDTDRFSTLIDNGILDFSNIEGANVSLKTVMSDVQKAAKDAYEELNNGAEKDVATVNKLKDIIKECIKFLNEYNTTENQIVKTSVNKNGKVVTSSFLKDFIGSRDSYSNKELGNTIIDNLVNTENSKYYGMTPGKFEVNADDMTATLYDQKNGVYQLSIGFQTLRDQMDLAGEGEEQLITRTRLLKESYTEMPSATERWLTGLKSKLGQLTRYMTGMAMISRVMSQVRSGFSFIKEMDSSLTTINMTMDTTSEKLAELGKSSIEMAKDLGTTATEVLKAAAIYANASETVESVLEKAKATVYLSNASGADTSTTSNQIQAVTQQFEELEGKELSVVNTYEKISSEIAVDFAQGINSISEGVSAAGSVADEAGLSFEQFSASVAKVAEKTRNSGSSIGNAYKTIMARTSRSKSSDEDVSSEDRSNASKALSSVGINVYDSNGDYQDFSDTLDQLAGKWDTLTDAQRSYISEQMAGVRNINTMNAIVETWKEARDLAADAESDTDFYQETQDKWMTSMSAHINELKSAGQDFWNNVLDSGAINALLDGLTGIVNSLKSITDVFKTIGGIFGKGGSSAFTLVGTGLTTALGLDAIGSFTRKILSTRKSSLATGGNGTMAGATYDVMKSGARKTKDFFGNLGKAWRGEENDLSSKYYEQQRKKQAAADREATAAAQENITAQELKNKETEKETVTDIEAATTGEAVNAVKQEEVLGNEEVGASEILVVGAQKEKSEGNIEEAVTSIIAGKANEVQAEKDLEEAGTSGMASGAKGVGNALKGVIAGMSTTTLVIGGLIAGIAALSFASYEFNKHVKSSKEILESTNEAFDEYNESLSSMKTVNSEIETLGNTLEKFSYGVTSAGENISLTEDEFKEYGDAANRLAEIFKENDEKFKDLDGYQGVYDKVVSGYNTQGNAIINLTGGINSLTDAYKEQLKAAERLNLEENTKDYVKNFKNETTGSTGWTAVKDAFSSETANSVIRKAIEDIIAGNVNYDLFSTYYVNESSTLGVNNDGYVALANSDNEYGFFADAMSKTGEEAEKAYEEAVENLKKWYKNTDNSLNEAAQSAANKVNNLIQSYAKLSILDENLNVDEDTENNILAFLGGTSADYIEKMIEGLSDGEIEEALQEYANNIINAVANDKDINNALNNLLNINSVDLDISEYVNEIESDLDTLHLKLGIDKEDLARQLDLVDTESGKILSDAIKEKYAEVMYSVYEQDTELMKGLSEDEKAALKEYNKIVSERELKRDALSDNERYWGNVDQYSRKIIEITDEVFKELQDKELIDINTTKESLGDYMTTFGMNDQIENGVLAGQQIMYTPILPDGTILDRDTLDEYINDITKNASSEEDVLNADTLGIINGVTDISEDFAKGLIENAIKDIDIMGIDGDAFAKLRSNVSNALIDAFDLEGTEVEDEVGDTVGSWFEDIVGDETDFEKIKSSIIDNSKEITAIVAAQKESTEQHNKQADLYQKEYSYLKKIGKASLTVRNNQKAIMNYIKGAGINTINDLNLLVSCIEETDNLYDAITKCSAEKIDIDYNDEKLDNLESQLSLIETQIENINDASSATHTSKGLNKEQINNIVSAFSELEDYDYDKLFESTAEGVKLNTEQLEKLTDKYRDFNRGKYTDEIKKLKEQYQAVCKQIGNVGEQTDLLSKKSALANQIKEAEELQSIYEGMTNAVTEWQNAQSATKPGDTYKEIYEAIEDMEEIAERGQLGDTEFQAFVQMFSNEELTNIDDFIGKYEKALEKSKKYFTENASGCETFLNDLHKLNAEWATQNSDGSWTMNFNVAEVAEQMDISQAAIMEILDNLELYAFRFDFTEETDYLREVREEAEKLRETVSKEYQLDLTVKDKDAIKEQVESGKKLLEQLDSGTDEYKALWTQVDYLNEKLGEMSNTTINLDVSTTDGLQNIKDLIDKLKQLKVVGEDFEINWNWKDPDYYSKKIDEVKKGLDELKNTDGKINIETEGGETAYQLFITLQEKKYELSEDIILGIDTSKLEEDSVKLATALQEVEKSKIELDKLQEQLNAGFDVNTDSAKNDLASIISDFRKNYPDVSKDLGLDDIKIDFDKDGNLKNADKTIDSIQEKLSKIDGEALVELGIDASAIEGYEPPDKELDVTANLNKDQIDDLDKDLKKPRTYTVETDISDATKDLNNYESKVSDVITKLDTASKKANSLTGGNSSIDISTNKTGNSWLSSVFNALTKGKQGFASGTDGATSTDTALVGELGAEMRVDPKTGTWDLLGLNGAEFADIHRGDIIFNHKQTRELLETGKINSRGKALVTGNFGTSGNAYASSRGTSFTNASTSNSFKGANKFYGNALTWADDSNSDDNSEEDFDWIEILIDRIERKIEELDTIASSVYKNFSKRNNALAQEFSKVTEEIGIQQEAYNAYIDAANSVGLSSGYAQLVRNGAIKLETITDEDLKEKISKYQEFYEKALDCQKSIQDLNEKLGDLAKQKFDNVVSQYDKELQAIQNNIDKINNGLDIVEARGQYASKNYYEALMSYEQQNQNKLNEELNSLQSAFNEAMNSGTIEKNSEAWYDMKNQIAEVEKNIQNSTKALIEYQNQMREMDWSVFEKTQDYISELTKESEFLIDLMNFNEDELYDRTFNSDTNKYEYSGKLSDKGLAVQGLRAVNYNTYMAQADEYAAKVKELNAEIAKDPTNTKLIDQRNTYLQSQRDSIKAAQDEKKSIQDLIKNAYSKMLETINELIERKKTLIEQNKSLYDYEKNIADQTKSIDSYRKQIAALSGDNSEEAMSKRQQLNKELEDAQQSLEESMYSQWVSDQNAMLDNLSSDFENLIGLLTDDINTIISEAITSTNENASAISQTITDVTGGIETTIDGVTTKIGGVGYQITDAMAKIWDSTNTGIGHVVSEYSSNFSKDMSNVKDYINSCKLVLDNILKATKDQIAANTANAVKSTTTTTTSSSTTVSSAPTQSSSSSSSSSQPASKQGNGQVDVGDIVTYTGKYYYDSYGSTKKTGTKYAGVSQGVVIDKVNNNPYGVHIHSADGKYSDLGWVN